MRIAAIQKIEANVTRNVQKAKFHEPITETKSSNVRRRSETPRLSDSPRTRVRFGSDPYSPNSLITSAVTPSSSPSLSVASSATHRPRVILGKKASSVHSNRSVCSKSSAGGADSSSSVRTAASASSDKVDSPISSSQLVLAPSLSTSSSPEIGRQAQFQGPLPDLFTGFNGFTLRPPEKMQLAASSTKDGCVPPKLVSITRLSKRSAPSEVLPKRSAPSEVLPSLSYRPQVPCTHFDPPLSDSCDSISSTASSPMFTSAASSASGTASLSKVLQSTLPPRHSVHVLEPVSNSVLAVSKKSNSTVFSFFRRASKLP